MSQLLTVTLLKDTYRGRVVFKNEQIGQKLCGGGRVQKIVSTLQPRAVGWHAPRERAWVDFRVQVRGLLFEAPDFAGLKYGIMASHRSIIGNAALRPVLNATTSASHVE